MATPPVTGRVMVTVKADSKEKAIEIGRSLTNFQLDESQDPLSFVDGEWIIFGTATGGDITSGGSPVTADPEDTFTTQKDDDQK